MSMSIIHVDDDVVDDDLFIRELECVLYSSSRAMQRSGAVV